MSTKPIHRQDEETTIPELYGQRCSAFGAVVRSRDGHWGLAYLQLDGGWHRFYFDAGLLFWSEIPAPNLEDDLGDGQDYRDIGVSLRVLDAAITRIEMRDCTLVLEFGTGARVVLRCGVENDGAQLLELKAGQVLPAELAS